MDELQTQAPRSFSVPVVANPNDQDPDAKRMVVSSNYLPMLVLAGSSNELVKAETIRVGYLLQRTKDQYTELGKTVDIGVISWRPKAVNFNAINPKTNTTRPESYYKVTSPEFVEVERLGKAKKKGYMFGSEFLVYVPQMREFATFFMGSATARREGPVVMGYIANEDNLSKGKGKVLCTLGIVLLENTENSWHATRTMDCTTPPAYWPTDEELIEQQTRFLKPPERAEEPTTEEAAAAGQTRDI